MLKLFAGVLLITFVLVEINGVCENDATPENCWVVFCANVISCPVGQQLVLRNTDECVCCNHCIETSTLQSG